MNQNLWANGQGYCFYANTKHLSIVEYIILKMWIMNHISSKLDIHFTVFIDRKTCLIRNFKLGILEIGFPFISRNIQFYPIKFLHFPVLHGNSNKNLCIYLIIIFAAVTNEIVEPSFSVRIHEIDTLYPWDRSILLDFNIIDEFEEKRNKNKLS